MTKALIFDSGTLITFTMTGMLDVLQRLKPLFSGAFLITSAVKEEVIDRPLNVHRFELDALRVQQLLEQGILELPISASINTDELNVLTRQLLEKANHAMQVRGAWVNLVSEAEMSCLALATMLERQHMKTLIAIDERTTRLLCEKPQALEKMISERLHQRALMVAHDLSGFAGYRFIRSSELMYVAFKRGVLGIEGRQALEAALYATKSKGAAISHEEIEALKKL